jgi:antitoxin component of RelBE/YafQ-DinJ toxin-antitoxin module
MKTVIKMRIKAVINENNHPINIYRPASLLEAIKLLPKLMDSMEKSENDNMFQRDSRQSEIGLTNAQPHSAISHLCDPQLWD